MCSTGLQRSKNRLADSLLFPPQRRIPKPQLLDAHGIQKPASFGIMGLLFRKAVAAPIQFDREPSLLAKEVQEVFSQRMLAPKFVSVEPSIAQPTPDEFLSPSPFLSQSACLRDVGHAGKLASPEQVEKKDRTRLGLQHALTARMCTEF
jgi:hypothetical protein